MQTWFSVFVCYLAVITVVDGLSAGMIFTEIFHVGLVINDLASDIFLFRNIEATKEKYEKDHRSLVTKQRSPYYAFEYCYPSALKNASWEVNVENTCACYRFQAKCNETGDINHNYLYISEEQSYYDNETDLIDDFYQIAQESVSCASNIWALEYPFIDAYTFDEWRCAQCECAGNLYNEKQSAPLQRNLHQYDSLYDSKLQYCDARTMTDEATDNLDLLDNLYTTSIAFLIIGCIAQFSTIMCRAYALSRIDEDIAYDEDQNTSDFLMNIVRFGLGFFVSLMEDVPQTIIAMYYVQVLYADHGYHCFMKFSKYPELSKMKINPQDSVSVILLENTSIAFAVASSMFMIVFQGIRSGFKLQKQYRKAAAGDSISHLVCVVSLLLFVTTVYILALLMPIAGVAYFAIAPTFHKDWIPALIVFIAGIISWFLLCFVFAVICIWRKNSN